MQVIYQFNLTTKKPIEAYCIANKLLTILSSFETRESPYITITLSLLLHHFSISEYRTEQSKQEIELLESLEELKELNRRQRAVDYEGMLKQYQPETTDERLAREAKEDDDFIK